MQEQTLIIITADGGKTFKRLSTNEILGVKISFDTRYDSVLNYAEVEMPPEEE